MRAHYCNEHKWWNSDIWVQCLRSARPWKRNELVHPKANRGSFWEVRDHSLLQLLPHYLLLWRWHGDLCMREEWLRAAWNWRRSRQACSDSHWRPEWQEGHEYWLWAVSHYSYNWGDGCLLIWKERQWIIRAVDEYWQLGLSNENREL